MCRLPDKAHQQVSEARLRTGLHRLERPSLQAAPFAACSLLLLLLLLLTGASAVLQLQRLPVAQTWIAVGRTVWHGESVRGLRACVGDHGALQVVRPEAVQDAKVGQQRI